MGKINSFRHFVKEITFSFHEFCYTDLVQCRLQCSATIAADKLVSAHEVLQRTH